MFGFSRGGMFLAFTKFLPQPWAPCWLRPMPPTSSRRWAPRRFPVTWALTTKPHQAGASVAYHQQENLMALE